MRIVNVRSKHIHVPMHLGFTAVNLHTLLFWKDFLSLMRQISGTMAVQVHPCMLKYKR